MNLTAIDPALVRMSGFAKATQNAPKHVQALRENAIFRDGALSGKVKTLSALLWAVNSRCEPCIKFYALKSRELGATDDEIGEMLAVAPAMGACVAEMWALKAFAAAGGEDRPLGASETGGADENCCSS